VPGVPVACAGPNYQCKSNIVYTYTALIPPKYHINRGSRDTRRISVRATVVVVVWYLRSLKTLAEALLAQVSSLLGAFEMEVTILCPLI
jgi:hypothetical protein